MRNSDRIRDVTAAGITSVLSLIIIVLIADPTILTSLSVKEIETNTAYAAETPSVEQTLVATMDDICPNGFTYEEAKPVGLVDYEGVGNYGYIGSFLIVPSERCAIPLQICTVLENGRAGGLDCTIIETP